MTPSPTVALPSPLLVMLAPSLLGVGLGLLEWELDSPKVSLSPGELPEAIGDDVGSFSSLSGLVARSKADSRSLEVGVWGVGGVMWRTT